MHAVSIEAGGIVPLPRVGGALSHAVGSIRNLPRHCQAYLYHGHSREGLPSPWSFYASTWKSTDSSVRWNRPLSAGASAPGDTASSVGVLRFRAREFRGNSFLEA